MGGHLLLTAALNIQDTAPPSAVPSSITTTLLSSESVGHEVQTGITSRSYIIVLKGALGVSSMSVCYYCV